MSRVLKWQDLYYKASKRVMIEQANFLDFQDCMRFNQEHALELQRIEEDLASGKLRPNGEHGGPQRSFGGHNERSDGYDKMRHNRNHGSAFN
ncbi:hypothetical protein CANTEDRAFT_123453, partial [Yamadazyma tenuis ATCC 10573]